MTSAMMMTFQAATVIFEETLIFFFNEIEHRNSSVNFCRIQFYQNRCSRMKE